MHKSNSTGLRKLIAVLPILFLIGTLTTGCQTTRTLPDWEQQTVDETPADPISTCQWPDLVAERDGAFVDKEGLVNLEKCRAIATANFGIAAANADAVRQMKIVNDLTQEQAQRFVDAAEFQLNEIEDDRRELAVELWVYKGLLALGLIASAL